MTPTDYIKELVTENRDLALQVERLKTQLDALKKAQKEAAPGASGDGK